MRLQIYGDNSKETYDFCNEIVEQGERLNLFQEVIVHDEVFDQLVFECRLNKRFGTDTIYLKLCGNYKNWNLDQKIKDLLHIDIPDLVIYNPDNRKILCAAEFTNTVSVGNSQFQRQSRVVLASKLKVSFLITMPEIQMDRSQGTPRKPELEVVANHFFLACKFKTPSLIILESHKYSFNKANKDKEYQNIIAEKKNIENLKYSWFLLNILNELYSNKFYGKLKKIEKDIYGNMYKYLSSKTHTTQLPIFDYKLFTSKNYLDDLIDCTHNKKKNIKSPILINPSTLTYDWIKHGKSGKVFNKSRFKLGFLNYIEKKYPNLKIWSYQNGAVIGMCFNTKLFLTALSSYYKCDKHKLFSIFEQHLPVIIITVLGYQKNGSLADPSTGEVSFFSWLFSNGNFKNIIVVVFGPTPRNWEHLLVKRSNKLARSICDYSYATIYQNKLIILKN